MATPPLTVALEVARTRLQAALDEQLAAIDSACTAAVSEAHAAAHAVADERWTAKFESLQAASTTRADAALAEAAAAAEDRRTRELEEAKAEAAVRHSAAAAAAAAAVTAADESWQGRFAILQTGSHAAAPAIAAPAASASVPPASDSARSALRRLEDAVQTLSAAASLSTILDSLAAAARHQATRVALFVVNGPALDRWWTSGFDADHEPVAKLDLAEAGPLADAVESGKTVVTESAAAPAFAIGSPGVSTPLTVGGRCVAVLYAGVDGSGDLEVVHDTIAILAQHASTCLACVTAEALATAAPIAGPAAAPSPDDDSSARRYARLLVSEIKLYNESAVRVGRERRDLLSRLRPEIDRARRLYEERVPQAAGSRQQLFQEELVQTLAEGDPALLGASD